MTPSLLFAVLLPLGAHATDIRRIQNADGSIEFSNVIPEAASQTVIYKSQGSEGFVFSDQKPSHGSFEVLRYDCYACNPDSPIDWYAIRLDTRSFAREVAHVADKYGVDPALIRAVIHAESAFNPHARSRKGAQGLMQLMPGTARELGVTDAFDAGQNIEGGVRYLASLLEQFEGDIELATAAYNAGPNAVKKFNGIPPYSETEVYVKRVAILHQRYQRES